MDQASRSLQQLGAALRRSRRKLRLTQAALGARVNRRQATVSALEAGAGGTLDTLFAVLAALDLELVLRPRQTTAAVNLQDLF